MYLKNYCPNCVFDGKCYSQRDPDTTYCTTDAEHKAIVFSGMCDNFNVSERSVISALGDTSYLTMSDEAICEFVKQVAGASD